MKPMWWLGQPSGLAVRLLPLLLAVGVALALLVSADRASADDGVTVTTWTLVDHSQQGGSATLQATSAIDYFTSGTPPVQWADADSPVPICTHQDGRPASVSAQLFRDTVRDAAQVWSNAGAAVGYEYTGDCTTTSRQFRNGVNEVAFDTQNEVDSPTAALTHGAWSVGRKFIEIDVLLHAELAVADQCLFSVIVHELGHGIGFGHSSAPGHLMYPTFDGQQISTCITAPTQDEKVWLIELYGANRPPTVTVPDHPAVYGGVLSSLTVRAQDSDGGALTYVWTQLEGPQVAFSPGGATITFTAPNQVGETIAFRVDVYDRYLARTTQEVTATIQEPPETGSFSGRLPVQGGYGLIVWDGGPVESLVFTAQQAGCQLISLWSSVDGRLMGYTPGAPGFVNASWKARYPEALPEGLGLLAVCARR